MATKLRFVEGGPPRPLGVHGRALWDRIQNEYDITDAGGVELLTLAAQSLDRAEGCRELIDRHGEAVISDVGIVKENPLMKTELACRAFAAKCIERLGLNAEPAKAVG